MNGLALYNEIDDKAAAWLEQLIGAGHIAPGIVDRRSIEDLEPDYVRQFAQVHFFAGIGVWSHALRRAGWADDRPVWTGSCPCQPFSAAGKGGGFDDERHLWPAFHHLIAQCRPDVVLGEQVASKDGLNWLDLVHADLEGEGYAVGAVDTCAAGFGAPHIRQRLYWSAIKGVADAELPPQSRQRLVGGPALREQTTNGPAGSGLAVGLDRDTGNAGVFQGQSPAAYAAIVGLADAVCDGTEHGPRQGMGAQAAPDGSDGSVSGKRLRLGVESPLFGMADANGGDASAERQQCSGQQRQQPQDGVAGKLADASVSGRERGRSSEAGDEPGTLERPERFCDADRPGPTNGHWRDADWLGCRDGKWRPVEPGTFPLANGAPARVGRLRGYGNAIVAPQAQAFVETVREYLDAP